MSTDTLSEQATMLRHQLFRECRAMAQYGLERGIEIPGQSILTIDSFEQEIKQNAGSSEDEENDTAKQKLLPGIKELAEVHSALAKALAPATPHAIVLLDTEKNYGRWRFLGPIPLVKQLMLLALVSLVVFIGVVLSPDINNKGQTIFSSQGIPLLINLVFLLSSASLGASFSALYKVNKYITKLTFEPNQQTSYWIRFLLGLISGLMLALVISEKSMNTELLEPGIVRPLLAILGGFSADLVYTFLNRMIETVKSLFLGSSSAIVEARAQEEKAKLAGMNVNNQIKLASELMKVQQEIDASTNSEEVRSKLNTLLTKIMPT